ncbi:Arginase/deacetylase [Hymenopellis radicata]|nr:Arginase/deacetylase [Hymenopellis radicata]
MLLSLFLLATTSVYAHSGDFLDISNEEWTRRFGPQKDLAFTGPNSFMHLPYARCLEDSSQPYDIAILGMPFDTTTSYRPGARFGPQSIRTGSGRAGYTLAWGSSPSDYGRTMVDCGDVPVTQFDNAKAIEQMEVAYSTLLSRPVKGGTSSKYRQMTSKMALDGKEHPQIVTLGGDHTIVLPILRALYKVYGPISVIHFDSHFDTGNVTGRTEQDRITHGSYFAVAYGENLMTNTSIHGGIRQKTVDRSSLKQDESVGFQTIAAEDIDDYGVKNIVKRIRERVGSTPVYLSLDIDVIDPGLAPATGTPEVGGWTTREMRRIIRGLSGLNFVGADIVEVAPAYDGADEMTSRAAAAIVHDFLNMLQIGAPPKKHPGIFE